MPGDAVIIVYLRQPVQSDRRERRSDPFWEFGSFGCTGCHKTNLMNPKRLDELTGVRFAFAQGGRGEVRLVHLTPPVSPRRHNKCNEVVWSPKKMPMRFEDAPLLIANDGSTDFPYLKRRIAATNRSTWVGKLSSMFRSCRTPLPSHVGNQLIRGYEQARRAAGRNAVCRGYEEAMQVPPPFVDPSRRRTYASQVEQLAPKGGCNRSGRAGKNDQSLGGRSNPCLWI